MPDPSSDPTTGTPPRVPRWVVVSGTVVGVLVLVFIVVQLTGLGGQHGPGRHLPGGGSPPASVTGPPAGGH
ncbi:hypothetical protein [Actinophytocola sp.]|uniref:hypothetical protein n=1 Tax=Actinophytocola sp. TaxID=1872138 RepID=UPI002D80C503|nr:hypothetical protein [Actinophytocola sp.]HET9139074.1 hypothetical protein [Actinophytocola sp.]